MSSAFPSNRENLQKILEGAFAVQQYRMDAQPLAAYLETQRLIVTGQLEGDAALQSIAECVRMVARADGAAIGLVHANQLTYRAGSGSAAQYVGSNLIATLNASSGDATVKEILRVEDASTDKRIVAAICRQFAAQSLLMFAIQYAGHVVGVLQVSFLQPHNFEEREVRAYQLMAGLIDKAKALEKKAPEIAVPSVVDPSPLHAPVSSARPQESVADRTAGRSRMRNLHVYSDPILDWLRPRLSTTWLRVRSWSNRIDFENKSSGSASSRAAVAVVLLATTTVGLWIGYSHRRPQSSGSLRGAEPAPAFESQPFRHLPMTKPYAQSETEHPASPIGPGFRSVRVSDHEIDYVSDDVTIRHFLSIPAKRTGARYREVERGNDVTIRYYALTPAFLSKRIPASQAQRQQR